MFWMFLIKRFQHKLHCTLNMLSTFKHQIKTTHKTTLCFLVLMSNNDHKAQIKYETSPSFDEGNESIDPVRRSPFKLTGYKTVSTTSDAQYTQNGELNDVVNLSYYKLFGTMINHLMNSTERNLFYLAILFTICCGILRLMFFIFVSAIIDLLAGSYHGNLHKLCPSEINCESDEILIHVFIVILVILSMIATVMEYGSNMIGSIVSSSFLTRLNCMAFNKIITQNLSFFDVKEHRDFKYLLSRDMKHIRFSVIKVV